MYFRVSILTIIFATLITSLAFGQRKRRLPKPVKAYNHSSIDAPPGMVYVPGGSIIMKYGSDPKDSASYRRISLSPFFIDETEVTNAQYRAFIDWVVDSILVTEYLNDKKYFLKTGKNDTARLINWKKVGTKPLWRSRNSKVHAALQPMLDHERLRQDMVKFGYVAREKGKTQKDDRYVSRIVNIYPNTLVWSTDFPNSQVDIMVQDYFDNPAFDDYPVVGVTWEQAQAYAAWRSMNSGHKKKSKYALSYQLPLSLPSEAQWVYAAKGEDRTELIPSGDSSIAPKTRGNGLAANFKQSEGEYAEDGSSYTVHVMSYSPNEFGLYNMVGNVAEWTLDAYNASAWAFVHDQNPVLIYHADSNAADIMKRKVVRGGSWKDNGNMLSPYTRSYEIQDVPHSYIGFRCVMPAPEVLTKQVATQKPAKQRKRKIIKSK